MAEIDPKTRERLQALCHQIASAHGQAMGMQHELYGRMEGRLHAYLNGEERLTEQDALALVREHFGDPAVLKALLRDTHALESRLTFARRLAAVWSATTIVLALTAIFILFPVALALSVIDSSLAWSNLYTLLLPGAMVFSVFAVWSVLARWQRAIREGQAPWFLRWSMSRLTCFTIFVSLAARLVPTPTLAGPRLADSTSIVFGAMFLCMLVMFLLAQCLTWIWWCDRPPRSTNSIVNAWASWMAFIMLSSLIPSLDLAFVAANAGPSAQALAISTPQPYFYSFHGFLENGSSWWISWRVPILSAQLTSVIATGLTSLVIAVIARVSYSIAKRKKEGTIQQAGEALNG